MTSCRPRPPGRCDRTRGAFVAFAGTALPSTRCWSPRRRRGSGPRRDHRESGAFGPEVVARPSVADPGRWLTGLIFLAGYRLSIAGLLLGTVASTGTRHLTAGSARGIRGQPARRSGPGTERGERARRCLDRRPGGLGRPLDGRGSRSHAQGCAGVAARTGARRTKPALHTSLARKVDAGDGMRPAGHDFGRMQRTLARDRDAGCVQDRHEGLLRGVERPGPARQTADPANLWEPAMVTTRRASQAQARALWILRQTSYVVIAVFLYFRVRGLTEGSSALAAQHAHHILASSGISPSTSKSSSSGAPPSRRSRRHWQTGSTSGVTGPSSSPTMVWLVGRHRDAFLRLRDAMIVSGVLGILVFAAYPVSPPRLAGLGLIDTVTERSTAYRVLQPPALVNQYAAMPSLHSDGTSWSGSPSLRQRPAWPCGSSGTFSRSSWGWPSSSPPITTSWMWWPA